MTKSSFIVTPKYPLDSFVEFMTEDGKIRIGKVVAVRVYKSCHYAENKYTLTYAIIPEEFIGVECDEEIDIPECHTAYFPRCFPLILGIKGENIMQWKLVDEDGHWIATWEYSPTIAEILAVATKNALTTAKLVAGTGETVLINLEIE